MSNFLSSIFNSKKRKVFEESYVIIGPVGVGKSLVSEKLGKKTGLPVITLDLMRHCPRTIKEIEAQKRDYIIELSNLEEKLSKRKADHQREMLGEEIARLKNEIWVCERRIEMRKILPNLPNYNQFGFKGFLSAEISQNHGPVVWHFYQKQFENKLLKALVEQLDQPCVIDMGGGMSIALEDSYKRIKPDIINIYSEKYGKTFDYNNSTFSIIKKCLKPFKNVVYLTPPKNYQDNQDRMQRDPLNPLFLASKQYQKLAKVKIDTNGLLLGTGKGYDQHKMMMILHDIESQKEYTEEEHNAKTL